MLQLSPDLEELGTSFADCDFSSDVETPSVTLSWPLFRYFGWDFEGVTLIISVHVNCAGLAGFGICLVSTYNLDRGLSC